MRRVPKSLGKWSRGSNNICEARRLAAFVFFFPRVISFSARRWASLALCQVVRIDSWVMREVTMLRSMACRWAEPRLRWRYFWWPPAMVGGGW